MKYSIIASQIDEEYKRRKRYEKRERQNCKEKHCDNCKYQIICEESEKNYEI